MAAVPPSAVSDTAKQTSKIRLGRIQKSIEKRITEIEQNILENMGSPDKKIQFLLHKAVAYNAREDFENALRTSDYGLQNIPNVSNQMREKLFAQRARAQRGLQPPTAI